MKMPRPHPNDRVGTGRRHSGRRQLSSIAMKHACRASLALALLIRASSKKVENHASVALDDLDYNFRRIRKTLLVTRAMATGAMDRVWDMTDVAAPTATREFSVATCGPYKERVAQRRGTARCFRTLHP
jgi:hypothetical protein